MSKLTKQNKHAKKTKKSKPTPESTFYEALDRLKRIEAQNDLFQEKITALVARVTPEIEPHELKKYQALKDFTLKIIPFLSKKSLPEYMRDELHEWISSNLDKLSYNPFSDKIDLTDTNKLLYDHIFQLQKNKSEKTLKRLEKQGDSPEEIADAKELLNQLNNANSFEEFLAQAGEKLLDDDINDGEDDDGFSIDDLFGDDDSLFDDWEDEEDEFDDFGWNETQQAAQEAEISRLVSATSINKLFRRIAKVIHPDLEQNEDKKIEKHSQMARLLEARDNKDIAHILHTYTTTFGQLPDDFPQADYPKLTKVINFKIEQVKQNKINLLDETPFHSLYHEWFDAPTIQKEALKIKAFIKEVNEDRKMYELLTKDITNIASIKHHLEMRMRANLFFDDY